MATENSAVVWRFQVLDSWSGTSGGMAAGSLKRFDNPGKLGDEPKQQATVRTQANPHIPSNKRARMDVKLSLEMLFMLAVPSASYIQHHCSYTVVCISCKAV